MLQRKYVKVPDQEQMTYADQKLRSMTCAVWVLVALIVGFMTTVVVLLAVLKSSGTFTQTMRMTESTIAMGDRSAKAEQDVKAFLAQNKFDETIAAGQRVVGNTERITSRVATLLETMDPQTVPQVLDRAHEILSSVGAEDVTRLMATLAHAQELFASITPDHIQKLVDGVGELSVHVGRLSEQAETAHSVEKITLLTEQLRTLAERANQLSQIKIAWDALNPAQ
jgi:type III secretory pathway component EscV